MTNLATLATPLSPWNAAADLSVSNLTHVTDAIVELQGLGTPQAATVNVGGATATLTLATALPAGLRTIEARTNLGPIPPYGVTISGAAAITLSTDRKTITLTLPGSDVFTASDWVVFL